MLLLCLPVGVGLCQRVVIELGDVWMLVGGCCCVRVQYNLLG